MDRVLSPYELAWRRSAGHEPPEESPAPVIPASAPAPEPSALEATIAVELDPAAAVSAPALVEPAELTATFTSSNIRAAALDAETGVIEVEFNNGKRYRYANFTPALLAEWRSAKSPGGWFDASIKKRPDRHPPITEGK